MKKHKRAKNEGKQYDHEHFGHGGKGTFEYSGNEHHNGGESHNKLPHEASHDNSFEQYKT